MSKHRTRNPQQRKQQNNMTQVRNIHNPNATLTKTTEVVKKPRTTPKYPSAPVTNTAAPKLSFPYTVHIFPKALVKLNLYAAAAIQTAPTEIGGLAKISVDKDQKCIFVEDVHMFEQSAHAAFFEISADSINSFTREMIKSKRADELPAWRSIVHSHPEGMGPSMSGLDVDELKKFAAEGDAFSLIISASKDATSTRMYMHYCCNVLGEKQIVSDIPVGIATTGDRIDLANKVSTFIRKELGNENLNTDDIDLINNLSMTMLTKSIPGVLAEERTAMKERIDEHVAKLIKPIVFNRKGAPTSSGGYQRAAMMGPGGWDGTKRQDVIGGSKPIDQMTEQELCEEADRLLDEDAQKTNSYYQGKSRKAHEFEMELDAILKLEMIWHDRVDPNDEKRMISDTRANKTKKMWELRVNSLNEKMRKQYDIGLYDRVIVNYDNVLKGKSKINEDLALEPHQVQHFCIDPFGASFEVGDDGEMFWSDELQIIQTFEERMKQARDEQKAQHENTNQKEVAAS